LTGFTIKNGSASSGGGIYGAGAAATISYCVIKENDATSSGGGGIYNCDGLITNCTIVGNSANNGGGLGGCYGDVINCIIAGNQADGDGGGVYGDYESGPTLINCTIHANVADADDNNDGRGGGVCGAKEMTNCILWANTAYSSPQKHFVLNEDITYSCIEDWSSGGAGNISSDPMFVDEDGPDDTLSTWGDNDLHLAYNSPCLDAGDPNGTYTGQKDIDGQDRVHEGGGDDTAVVDIGADELHPIIVKSSGGDYTTIQAAINAASNGDTILVDEGTYQENIDFDGKNVAVRSSDPQDPDAVAATIIDGGNCGAVVTFSGSESSDAVLSGFTITNGYRDGDTCGGEVAAAGGIDGAGTSATISYCVITENSGFSRGGGLSNCDGLISNCTITDNSVQYLSQGGGGLHGCDGTITNCIIAGNEADNNGGGLHSCDGTVRNCLIAGNVAADNGGGLYDCDNGSIINCTIHGNKGDNVIHSHGGGLYGCATSITNCIIWANEAASDPQLSSCSTPDYSCIQGYTSGGTGNTGANPSFQPEFTEEDKCSDTGTWSADATYNSTTYKSTLTDSGASWTIDALIGKWVNLDLSRFSPAKGVWQYYVCDNTATTLTVWGDAYVGSSSPYPYARDDDYYQICDDWYPYFLPRTAGSWSSAGSHSSSTRKTTLTDSSANWGADDLIGQLVNPDTNQDRVFVIVDNTATTIVVSGDASSIAANNDDYQIYNYHLQEDSPCVDAGDSGGSYTGQVDMDGIAREVDFPLIFKSGKGPADIGAYEYNEAGDDPQDPLAIIDTPPINNTETQQTFTAYSSGDRDGTISSYAWDFGDGVTANGVSVNHTFADDPNTPNPESYTIALTVTDNDGRTDTHKTRIWFLDNDPDWIPDLKDDNNDSVHELPLYELTYDWLKDALEDLPDYSTDNKSIAWFGFAGTAWLENYDLVAEMARTTGCIHSRIVPYDYWTANAALNWYHKTVDLATDNTDAVICATITPLHIYYWYHIKGAPGDYNWHCDPDSPWDLWADSNQPFGYYLQGIWMAKEMDDWAQTCEECETAPDFWDCADTQDNPPALTEEFLQLRRALKYAKAVFDADSVSPDFIAVDLEPVYASWYLKDHCSSIFEARNCTRARLPDYEVADHPWPQCLVELIAAGGCKEDCANLDTTTAVGTTTTIKVADASIYAVNDYIEYDNDAELRKVTATDTGTDTVTFADDALDSASESGKDVYIFYDDLDTGDCGECLADCENDRAWIDLREQVAEIIRDEFPDAQQVWYGVGWGVEYDSQQQQYQSHRYSGVTNFWPEDLTVLEDPNGTPGDGSAIANPPITFGGEEDKYYEGIPIIADKMPDNYEDALGPVLSTLEPDPSVWIDFDPRVTTRVVDFLLGDDRIGSIPIWPGLGIWSGLEDHRRIARISNRQIYATAWAGTLPRLSSSTPRENGTLPKEKKNRFVLTFDSNITWSNPNDQALVIKRLDSPYTDVSDKFQYSVVDNTKLRVVQIDDDTSLVHQKWYHITPDPDFDIGWFAFDLAYLKGDCDGNGKVESAGGADDDECITDIAPLSVGVGDAAYRYDLNASGIVDDEGDDNDIPVITANLNDEPDAKP